jgi:acrylyl-CoA reductase (NADPH)
MPVGDFKALVLDQIEGAVSAAIRTLSGEQLPEGDITVAVTHSGLNYKDGLILKGQGGLVRSYPHVPGIDFAGTVIESQASKFKPGDAVLLTGWRVGETHWGGYAECARVRGDWLLKRPRRLDAFHAMVLGTAGLTAMLAVMALEESDVSPESGEVLVTGANGGLGGIAIALLARAGFKVVAATGRTEAAGRLRALGAAEVIGRAELATPSRPLLSARWAACIDAVGGAALPAVLAGTRYGGVIASCGNAGGNELATTVLPFILRGVKLIGVDSVMCPMPKREKAWRRLAREMPATVLDTLSSSISLEQVPRLADEILAGQTTGRIVVTVA